MVIAIPCNDNDIQSTQTTYHLLPCHKIWGLHGEVKQMSPEVWLNQVAHIFQGTIHISCWWGTHYQQHLTPHLPRNEAHMMKFQRGQHTKRNPSTIYDYNVWYDLSIITLSRKHCSCYKSPKLLKIQSYMQP